MNHVFFGASIPFLFGVFLYLRRGGRASMGMLIMIPLAMAFLGAWAVAPDIPRMLGHHELYSRLAADPRMDIFLWHHSLDQMEMSTRWYSVLELESPWFTVGIAMEAAALMGAAIRELFREEKS